MISKNRIKHIHSLELKKNREKEQLFVAEGPKLVGDLLAVSTPAALIATEYWYADNGINPRAADSVVTQDELLKASFLQHPQQVIGIFPIPHKTVSADICTKELCLALDGIQDPGNLGTIIRLAEWFGISTIFCGDGTADTFSPKVVQATMGSIARVNVVYTGLCRLISSLPADTPVYATSLDGKNIYEQELTPAGLIIMGNEGKGVSPQVMSMVNRTIFIPRYCGGNGIDSLNVAIATAVTCAEFRRRNK